MAPRGSRGRLRWLFDPAKVNPFYFRSELTWRALFLHLAGLAIFVSLLALQPVARFLGVGPLAALGLVLLNAIPQSLMTLRAQRRGGHYHSLLYEVASVHANFGIIAGFLALSRDPLTPLWAFYLLYVGVVAQAFGFQASFVAVMALAGLVPGLRWQLHAAGAADASPWMVSGAFTFLGLWQYVFLGSLRDQAHRLAARARELEQQRRLDEERAHLSREIHDGLGSQLAGAILTSHVALRHVSPTEVNRVEVSRAVTTLRQKVGRAERELQFALWSGRAPASTLRDLLLQLELSLREVCRASQVSLVITLGAGVDAALTALQRHHLMRILDEAVSNALHHARPSRLEISARRCDGALEIAVDDNGTGFPDDQEGAGRGLRNMRSRARELGGAFLIRRPGPAGTVVSVRVPLLAVADGEVAGSGDRPFGLWPDGRSPCDGR